MAEQTQGTVSLLFSDIEGSTTLLRELGRERYAGWLETHRRLLREAFERHGGYEVDSEGDVFFVAFHEVVVKRLMTDNGFSYVKNRSLRELLARNQIHTSPPSPTGHAPTARSSASTKPWPANGPTASPTAHTTNATKPCHTGSSTTRHAGHTARSETNPRSDAFTTSVGRTFS
jgi:hypothetical protein